MESKKDPKKDVFTNEQLSKKFVSQFDLVNYAIRLAENMIASGREPRMKTELQNRSMQILAEITEGKDYFDEIPEERVYEPEEQKNHSQEERTGSFSTQSKYAEKKKSRKP